MHFRMMASAERCGWQTRHRGRTPCARGLVACRGLRCDSGLVFTSRRYTATVAAYGLMQEFITPYTPEQSGVVERFIRSLKEECAWQHRFESNSHARDVIGCWMRHYNTVRPIKRSVVARSQVVLDIDAKDPLEALRPTHRSAAFCRCRLLRTRARGMPASPAGRCHPRAMFAVGGKHAMCKRVRFTRSLGTRAASRAMKPSGSNMTCVVPSRYGVFNW